MTINHDIMFKAFLTDVQVARDFLTIHLPEHLLKLCDLSTLHIESGSLIDPDQRAHYTDILYSVRMADEQGEQRGYIYQLIEHQSKPDPLIAFRLMRYCISIMQQHLLQGYARLPLVIPMLFYHGETSPYPYSTHWFSLFDQVEVARNLYSDAFPLVDVTVIPDEEIMAHKRVALLELTQKNIRRRDIMDLVKNIASMLQLRICSDEQLKTLISYIFEYGNSVKPDYLLKTLAKGSPEYKEVVMSIAQQLEERGKQRGLEEGLHEGLQKGRQEGMLEGRKEGLQEGRKEGMQEGRMKFIRELLASGINLEDLKKKIEITEEEIRLVAG